MPLQHTLLRSSLSAVAVLLALGAPPLGAQARDSAVTRTVAAGVVHRRIVRPAGPWWLNVLEVDLRQPALSVELARAGGTFTGRQRPSEIARTLDARWCPSGRRVLAAITGDLFELATGENEGNQIVAGALLKAGPTTDSPWDTFDNAHAQFAIDAHGRPLIERFAFAGELIARRPQGDTTRVRLDGVNTRRGGAAVLYTAAFGSRTPGDSARGPLREIPFTVASRRGDTLALRRAGSARAGGPTAIPAGGAVLSIADSADGAWLASDSAPGDLGAVLRLSPDRGPLRTLVGGWGRLLADGVVVADRADSVEGTFPRFSTARHPRTAVGFSRDSATLYLVAVDGRQPRSVGMTFAELAATMRELGAWNALNLDGGGSTVLVVRGRVTNVPSDSTGERPVGNVLLVVRRTPPLACPVGGR
jgi:hypothetical protein